MTVGVMRMLNVLMEIWIQAMKRWPNLLFIFWYPLNKIIDVMIVDFRVFIVV